MRYYDSEWGGSDTVLCTKPLVNESYKYQGPVPPSSLSLLAWSLSLVIQPPVLAFPPVIDSVLLAGLPALCPLALLLFPFFPTRPPLRGLAIRRPTASLLAFPPDLLCSFVIDHFLATLDIFHGCGRITSPGTFKIQLGTHHQLTAAPYSHRAFLLLYFCSCAPISHTLICPCPIPLHAVSPRGRHQQIPSLSIVSPVSTHSPAARLHSLVGFQTIGCLPSTNHITLASSLNPPSSTL